MFSINIIICAFIVCVSAFDLSMFWKTGEYISRAVNKVMFSNDCFVDLGCFPTGPPYFDPIHRPLSLRPFSPDRMDTKFILYTPTLKEPGYRLEPNEESLEASTFDATFPTKIIIHGYFTRVIKGDPLLKMKDAFLEEGDYNVILVDWSRINAFLYSQAIANSRMVGAQIAQLVRFLERTRGIKSQSVHLIGHSLGAHVAGYAGEKIPKLGRITGLDPAGPFFCRTDKKVRLDSTDAEFVDVIHTNAARLGIIDGLGIPEAIGHVDFYPNGGRHQPFCGPTVFNIPIKLINIRTFVKEDGWNFLACDHDAANKYFIESIKYRNCTFVGRECASYKSYLDGNCKSNPKAAMCFQARKVSNLTPGKKFYLTTSNESPYCIDHENQWNKLEEIAAN